MNYVNIVPDIRLVWQTGITTKPMLKLTSYWCELKKPGI